MDSLATILEEVPPKVGGEVVLWTAVSNAQAVERLLRELYLSFPEKRLTAVKFPQINSYVTDFAQ